jgi:hypothetical protein
MKTRSLQDTMKYIPRLLDESDIETLRNLPGVLLGGQSTFYSHIPENIRQKLRDQLGLATSSRVPFRWIHGDMAPHVDVGAHSFENTYLVYLTDGEGQFQIGDETYPIEAGSGFVFSEGTQHQVTQTNGTSRLLLGPMSEQGFAVGFGGTSVSADGATTIVYVQQIDDPSGNPLSEYKLNDGDWQSLTFPLIITNTNGSPASNILKVLFTTNLTFLDDSGYIQPNSDGIQIGDTVLRNDGTKPTITIDGVSNYGGFVSNTYSYVSVYNIHVTAINGGALAGGGGWIGRYSYGSDATNNFIIGCSSDGPISNYSGGIVGGEAANVTGEEGSSSLTIVGCTSSGAIDEYGGGITGEYSAYGAGSYVYILKCSSSGTIGNEGGGITSIYAAESGGTCQVQTCYSTGTIGTNAGGIFGRYAGDNGTATATACYSRGNIGTDGGGIFGANAAANGGSTLVANCYTSGTITTEDTGFYGTGASEGAVGTNRYAANGNWDSSIASGILTMTPYISVQVNQPFEFRNIGPSPYSLTTIENNDVIYSFTQTIQAGSSTTPGVVSGYSSYSILEGGDATITVNGTTGAISTSSSTPVATYILVVRAVTNPYSITTFELVVNPAPPQQPTTSQVAIDFKGKSYDFSLYSDTQQGYRYVVERLTNPNIRFKSFEDYNKYKIAQASLKR